MIRHTLYSIYDTIMKIHDKICGVDFQERISSDNSMYAPYAPTPSYLKIPLYSYLKKNADGGIIDVGCGKGKMLVFFRKFPFSVVDGLEYSAEIAEIAKENMKKLGLSCSIINGDAAVFTNYDKYEWFYLFYPFGEEIMQKFINNLIDSVHRNNRCIHLIYNYPKFDQLLRKNGFVVEHEISITKFGLKIYRFDGFNKNM